MMKVEDLQNGLRVLTISFCIWDFDEYNITDVYNVSTIFKNEVFLEDLKKKADGVDLVVLANHIGIENQQNYETVRLVREYFENEFNYTVPIILLTAHTNKLVKRDCTFKIVNKENLSETVKVENCYTTESGYYAQQLYHLNYTLEEVEYKAENGSSLTGYNLTKVDYYESDLNKLVNVQGNGTDYGFLERFRGLYTKDTFTTAPAVAMRQEVLTISGELGLQKIRGYSKNRYVNYRFVEGSDGNESDSVHRFWANTLYPSMVFSEPNSEVNKKNKRCQEIVSLQMGDLRSDVHAGYLTTDEIYQLMPFDNWFYVYRNLSYAQYKCLKEEIDKCERQYYFRDALEDVCVDLYTNEYEYKELENISKNLEKTCGTPLANHEEVRAVSEDVNTTADIFLAYVEKFMQRPVVGVTYTESSVFSMKSLQIAALAILIFWLIGMISLIVLCILDKKKKKN